jgi:transposase
LEVRVGNVETVDGGRQVFGAVARAETDITALIQRTLETVGRTDTTKVTAFTDGCPSLRTVLVNAGVTKPPILDCWGGRPHGIEVPELGCQKPRPEPSMSHITRIGIDTSKAVFTLHCVDDTGRAVLQTNLRRAQLVAFFKKLPPTEIVMEACGSSHYWGRELSALGHDVRLIPPQYVKPFVKRAKNDRNDAEAICEAGGRPGMRFVPVKSAEQQAQAMVLKVRETLVGQRTQLANSLRGHAAEFGVVAGKGIKRIVSLLEAIEAETAIPAEAREMLALLGREIEHLDTRLAELDVKLIVMHKASPLSQLLATIPGIGVIIALTFALEIDPAAFKSGRHLAAWIGLTPKEHSTGGKQRLGGISRAGNERLRRLLVTGATAVIRFATRPGNKPANEWLLKLLARKPRKLVAVALANKMARTVWAMMTSGEVYRRQLSIVGAVSA